MLLLLQQQAAGEGSDGLSLVDVDKTDFRTTLSLWVYACLYYSIVAYCFHTTIRYVQCTMYCNHTPFNNMDKLIELPDDMFRQHLLQYMTIYDIVRLDTACMSQRYRPQLFDKIGGVILMGNKELEVKKLVLEWMIMRRYRYDASIC